MAHSKLYIKIMNSKEWKAMRAQVIAAHPYCQRCMERGLLTISQCVHHIIPIESGRTEEECRDLAYGKVSNCVALCFQCHADIHKAERSYTKEVIKERSQQRVEAWADALKRRMSGEKKSPGTD
jgi:5-methylcytosine-specific restriction endonuclease McrA